LLDEVMEKRGAGRKFLVVDITIQGLVQSEDQLGHVITSYPLNASNVVIGAGVGWFNRHIGIGAPSQRWLQVTTNAVRLHCHSVPKAGSEIGCGRAKAIAPAPNTMTTTIAIILDRCQMDLIRWSPFPPLDQFFLVAGCAARSSLYNRSISRAWSGVTSWRCDDLSSFSAGW
jgi:hypothetical protein